MTMRTGMTQKAADNHDTARWRSFNQREQPTPVKPNGSKMLMRKRVSPGR